MSKVKPVILKDNELGTEYTLEFNRETVKWAESKGFILEDIAKYPMTLVYDFVFYAFRMHHKAVARSYIEHLIDDIWGGIGGIPDGLLERLAELYVATYGAFNDEENDEKNAKVTVEL